MAAGGARELRERAAANAAASPLVQRGENREKVERAPFRPVLEDLGQGDLVARPVRSGGAFDPLGCRSVDVARADDVVAIVEGHPGRWLMITLTVDRSLWVGPEAAYQRCNDRVKEVLRVASRAGIHITALELQGKTGDGWPHWHCIVWAPEGRSLDELERVVAKLWRVSTEHVDHESGEVTWSRESIGRSQVDEARSREGVARYCAKYLLKSWPALPTWMGESGRQLRKLRISDGCFDWLESEGRHVRHRGGRQVPRSRRRPARKLFDRMASSGAQHAVFKREGERLRFVCTIDVCASAEGWQLMVDVGAQPIRLGSPGSMRWKLAPSSLDEIRRRGPELRRARRVYERGRRTDLEVAWDLMQQRRAEDEALQAP